MIKYPSLLLAFLVELAMLAALASWGFSLDDTWLKFLVGIGAPMLVIVVWGRWLSPQPKVHIPTVWRSFSKLVLYSVATLALFDLDRQGLAYLFGVAATYSLIYELAFQAD